MMKIGLFTDEELISKCQQNSLAENKQPRIYVRGPKRS